MNTVIPIPTKTHQSILQDCRPLVEDLMKVKPSLYWIDLGTSSLLSYLFFFLAISASGPLLWVEFLSFVYFSYRSLFFVHELIHHPDELRSLTKFYDVLMGFNFKLSSFAYEVHKYHHNPKFFGTVKDPEYDLLAGKKTSLLMPLMISAVLPVAMLVRYSLVSLVLPIIGSKARMFIYQRATTPAMALSYRRPYPTAEQLRRWYVHELGCSTHTWSLLLLVGIGLLPLKALILWSLGAFLVSAINLFRALVAHRYDSLQERSFAEQLADSLTVKSSGPLRLFWDPLLAGYHRLHHMFPKMPYYSLATAHRRLIEQLPEQHPYHEDLKRDFRQALKDIISPAERTKGSEPIRRTGS